jgi:hypothetical protein
MRWVFLAPALMIAIAIMGTASSYRNHPRNQLRLNQSNLERLAYYLRVFHEQTGRYPTNDEGLTGVRVLVSVYGKYGRTRDGGLCHTTLRPYGITGITGDPFIYENRRGFEKSEFAFSGATLDRRRHYSIRVDDGIYVWLEGAQRAYKQSLQIEHDHRLKMNRLIALLVLCGLGYFAVLWRCARRESGVSDRAVRTLGLLLLDSGLAVVAVGTILYLTRSRESGCYMPAYNDWLKPETAKSHVTITRKYRDRGIISEKAYPKIVNGLGKDVGMDLR